MYSLITCTEFLFVRDVEVEGGVEDASAVHLEEDDEQDGRDGGDPVERVEAVLEADSCA